MIDSSSKYFLEKEFNVRYSEMDYQKVLKPSAMLNFLQDLATEAADRAHFGYAEVSAVNAGWFLLKYHMDFNNYPQNIEDIVIKTEARGFNKLFASRDFEMYSKANNELLGRMISQWSVVNLETKSMISPLELFPFMNKIEKREDDLSFNKIHTLERVDYTEDFKIRFDDIDVNQHVNNMNYIVWAFEALPKEFKDVYKIKTLDMLFKKEIKFGNIVQSDVQIEGMHTIHTLKDKKTGEDLCLISVEFVNI